MQNAVNEFISKPVAGESYGSYCDRLEDAVVKITGLEVPTESAIQALAFIAMEAPSDFNAGSYREIMPFPRIQKFLSKLPEQQRTLFRVECEKLPRAREDRISGLLGVS